MKKIFIPLMTVAVVVSMILSGCVPKAAAPPAAPVAPPAAPAAPLPALFGLKDIPELKNKTAINTVLETGVVWDRIMPYIAKFTEQTGVKVNVERIASPVVYSKENVELIAATGHYDVPYVETAWTCEWSDYLYDLRELAAKYDPWGVAGFDDDVKHHAPSILICGQAYGKQMVLPGYTYQMAMFIRQDVFDDPTEQANFKAKYGYDLKPATTHKEIRDQGEFFTRKKGDLLKGKPLENDLYGLAMMAGAYQINDEFSSRLWGKGADYATVVKDAAGNVTEFVITKKDRAAIKETLQEYVDQTKFASPGCLTANFDFVVAQIGEGLAIIVPSMFINCFPWACEIQKERVPDAKLAVYLTPGGQPYTGAWSFGVCKDAKNPEGAYWLVRYLASKECQEAIMKAGGQPTTRMEVLEDPNWYLPANAYPFALVCDYLTAIYVDQAKYVPNYYYFNTKAGGKVYEMQMDTLAKAPGGELTVDQTVAELVSKTIELQTKFGGGVPISEEK